MDGEEERLGGRRNNETHPDSKEHPKCKEDKGDADDLNNMRGWLMAVAALFVGMAFQSAVQPPAWMPKPEVWSLVWGWKHPRDSALSPDLKKLAQRAAAFQFANTIIFSTALTLMTLLLVMGKSFAKETLWCIKIMFPFLSIAVASNFIIGMTDDRTAEAIIVVYIVLYATGTVLTVLYGKMLFKKFLKR